MIHEDKKFAQLYLRKIQGAEDKGLDWKLSFAQFKKLRQTKRCYYTGTWQRRCLQLRGEPVEGHY